LEGAEPTPLEYEIGESKNKNFMENKAAEFTLDLLNAFPNFLKFVQSQNLLVNFLEVLKLLHDIRLDGLVTLLPVSRAHLTMLISELESLDETVNILNVTTNRRIIHRDGTNNTLVIDDVGCTRVVTSIKHTVVCFTNLMRHIRHQGDLELTNTTLLLGKLSPSVLREGRVNRADNNLGVNLLECLSLVGKSRKLGRTDKGCSERIYDLNETVIRKKKE